MAARTRRMAQPYLRRATGDLDVALVPLRPEPAVAARGHRAADSLARRGRLAVRILHVGSKGRSAPLERIGMRSPTPFLYAALAAVALGCACARHPPVVSDPQMQPPTAEEIQAEYAEAARAAWTRGVYLRERGDAGGALHSFG